MRSPSLTETPITLLTEIHEVAGNGVSEDSVKVPLADIYQHTSVNVVLDNEVILRTSAASAVHEYPMIT